MTESFLNDEYGKFVIGDDGEIKAYIHNSDPYDAQSWHVELDKRGREVAYVVGQNPKLPHSFRNYFDAQGRHIARIYGENPKDEDSWRKHYDENGEEISKIFGDDPSNECNWYKGHGIMTADEILNIALDVMGDRAQEYDTQGGERSMRATVAAFNAITGHSLTERQGWAFMAVLKLVRAQRGQGTDSYVDGAAYFALMGEAKA